MHFGQLGTGQLGGQLGTTYWLACLGQPIDYSTY